MRNLLASVASFTVPLLCPAPPTLRNSNFAAPSTPRDFAFARASGVPIASRCFATSSSAVAGGLSAACAKTPHMQNISTARLVLRLPPPRHEHLCLGRFLRLHRLRMLLMEIRRVLIRLRHRQKFTLAE